ncbi:MAG TPA: insulinase family protein [Bacteroides sp.]|nr:insulinase family protein [Bacteroides sp.]
MKILISLLGGLIPAMLLFNVHDLAGQDKEQVTSGLQAADTLPFDQDVLIGKLDNGLTYYIRENKQPENRAQIWLAVNAGSILEDEDQLGLAHFVEHMAFNGTEDFAKQEIIDFLESIGMKFGPEINAYTGFDETVYMLQLPTDSAEILEKGFEILNQWAHKVSFEEEEIEKERGVVIEEWRLGRGAQMRMLDRQLPVIFRGSKYMDRLPIGTRESLETFEQESLKRFYRDWYRPDLMAVIAVGDFKSEDIQNLIVEKFSEMVIKENARTREEFPVPDHTETLYAITTDPEATNTMVSVYFKSDPLSENLVGDYRRMLTEQLYSRMMNLRLYELLNQAVPPYLYAYKTRASLARTKTIHSLNVAVKEDGIEKGFETVLTEAERIYKHGFTESELERTRTWMIRRMEKSFEERDKTESSRFASEYLRNFFENEPIPGIAYEFNAVKEMVPGITLEEVNYLAGSWMSDSNRVVLLSAPEKEDLSIPGESELGALFNSVKQKDILPYLDIETDEPILEELTTDAEYVSEDYNEKLDVTTWRLSNGITVMLKPTDFKNDEIMFQGYSYGGNSLVSDDQYRSSRAATDIISLSGLGEFELNALNKKLAGKVVSVFPYISELSEGISGNCSSRDVETMFQLTYLYLTRPRQDSSAYLSYKTRMQGVIENRFSDPESAFYDTLMVTLANYHFRKRPWSMEMLEEIDPADCYNIYIDRFSDIGDFKFVFVGSFDLDSIKPLIKTYFGSLPSTGREESWKDINLESPKGIIKKTVQKGIEPKSKVSLTFTGDYNWNRENNYALRSMVSVLQIKLREILREDMSGTYGTRVTASTLRIPKEGYNISISFGCDPDRSEELTRTVFKVIDSLKTFQVEPMYITKVSETQKRSFETSIKRNRYWLSNLVQYSFQERNPELMLEYPDLVSTLDPEMVQDAARQYFNTENYVQVVLEPAPGIDDSIEDKLR